MAFLCDFAGASLFLAPELLSSVIVMCEHSTSVDIAFLVGGVGALVGPPLAGLYVRTGNLNLQSLIESTAAE